MFLCMKVTVRTARWTIQKTPHSVQKHTFITAILLPKRYEIISKQVINLHPELIPTLT
jgi:hypothetical protein